MDKISIMLLSFGLSGMVIGIGRIIKNIYYNFNYNKSLKRKAYVEKVMQEKDVPFTVIDVVKEKKRIRAVNTKTLIVDGIEYSRKNSYFLEKDNMAFIVGKKEDYIIILKGECFVEEID